MREGIRRARLLVAAFVVFVAIVVLVATAGAATPTAGSRSTAGTISHVCPSSDRPGILNVSGRPGAGTELVPPGAINLQLCAYNGLAEPGIVGEPAFALLAQRFVGPGSQLDGLINGLDALPAYPPPGPYDVGPPAATACPADFGTAIEAIFEYPTGVSDPVTIDLSGCGGVSNGVIGRESGRVTEEIADLVPFPTLGTVRGEVQVCGGVAPGGCRVSTFTGCGQTPATCATTDRVAFLTAAARRTGTLRLRHARFSTLIPTGRYVVDLLADGPRIRSRLLEHARVRVRADHATTVVFTIAVP